MFYNVVNILRCTFFCVLMMSYCDTKASHVIGCEVNYTCVYSGATGDSLELELFLYRDCSGINAPATIQLTTQSPFIQRSIFLPLQNCYEVATNCIGLSTCNGGTSYGVERCVYRGVLFFERYSNWLIRVYFCCRNGSVTTVLNNGGNTYYIENTLNNTFGCNNSAKLINAPITVVCVGQPSVITMQSVDSDGDYLTYELVNPSTYPGLYVSYFAPYNYLQFISGGVSINTTGDIYVYPTSQEISMYAVLIKEYRGGILVGSSIHDFQLIASNLCVCQTLPVEWGGLTIEPKQGCNLAQWLTYSEVNNAYFELQKSKDGKNFTSVSRVQGYGNASFTNYYEAKDCIQGVNEILYYRVKQFDYDGKFTFSEIVCILNSRRIYFNKWNILGQEIR